MSSLKLKLITISLSIAFSLFLAEIFSRVYFFGTSAFSFNKTNSFGNLSNSGIIQYSENSNLTYELIPNLNTTYKLVDFKTNHLGFRDRNHTTDSSKLNVAVIGDSFTMGTGVSSGNVYVSKTEELLNKSNGTTSYEFFNLGVSGYNLSNYISVLNKYAITINPDLIIVGFCASNDQFKIGEDFNYDNFKIIPKKDVFWDSYLKKLIQKKFLAKKLKPVSYSKKQLEYINQEFEEIKKQTSHKNMNVIIFYMDMVYDLKRVNIVEKLAKQNGLSFVDTSKKMEHLDLKKYIVNELDPHPNEKAHLIFAKTLSSYILAEKEHLLPKTK